MSRLTKLTNANNIVTQMSYEGDFRLKKIEHIKESFVSFLYTSREVQSIFNYSYDYNNNKTKLKTFRKALPINETLEYSYDKKNQLLTATSPIRSLANETFTYDISGNLLKQTGQAVNSSYNENNQLTDDGTYTYKYDTKGNMIERIQKDNNKTTRYEWDIENQLIRVTTHETENAMPSETITYAYDGLGRRIEKNINGKIKRYIYDNEDILMEYDEENALQKYYVHGMGIDNPLAMLIDNKDTREDLNDLKAYYYHKDGMGSITSLTDKDGKEVEKYVYNAFGKMTIYDERDNKIEESQFDNPYSFTGREHDSETGLHYHRARYYNPQLAHWISEDPIEFNSGDINLYRYSFNNPSNYFDLLGLYGTSNCSYYDQRCSESGGNYYCNLMPLACNTFPQPKDPNPNKDNDFEGWSRCTRQCLQDCDRQNKPDDNNMCPANPDPNTDDFWDKQNTKCHVKCWTKCALFRPKKYPQ